MSDEHLPDDLDPVEIPITDSIDLHPFRPREIKHVVADYVEAAWERGFREVRLIHGRGIGTQREIVRAALSRHPLVTGYEDAPPQRGGWGATVAHLADSADDQE